jgi:signal transduction histidine kinase
MDEKIMDLKLNPEARRDLFLIFKEAINNLAKYSCCKHAWVSLRLENGWITMTIQDDGVGFEVANADDGNGLTNMRKRAQSMKGSLEIISRSKHGTKVALEFQVS